MWWRAGGVWGGEGRGRRERERVVLGSLLVPTQATL